MPTDDTVVTTRRTDGDWTRTAIQIPVRDLDTHEGYASFDVLDTHGKLLARINAFDYGNGGGDIDVIVHTNEHPVSVAHRYDGDIVFKIPIAPAEKNTGDIRVIEVHLDKPK